MSEVRRAAAVVQEQTVGDLVVSHRPKQADFLYHEDVEAESAVSVTMPVHRHAYSFPGLHPVFQQNLPEGYLGDVLRKAVAKLYGVGDLTMLLALGRAQLGRVAVVGTGFEVKGDPLVTERLDELLHRDDSALFAELLERYALYSGVSGVQPKVLVPASAERAALRTADYIVKSWGDDYPELAANEYFCMTLARRIGLEVSPFYLSDNGRLFIMERFDRTVDRRWLGFEDGCVLQGRTPAEKYEGTYERLAKSLATYISKEAQRQGLHQFFLSILVSWAVRNGDAHLKNFGILYENPSAARRLAPAYDIVSTVVYLKNDVPALSLGGRKAWWKLSALESFARVFCGLHTRQVRGAFADLERLLPTLISDIRVYREGRPAFADVGRSLEEILEARGREIAAYLAKAS